MNYTRYTRKQTIDQISKMIGITEEEYCEFLFANGQAFLREYTESEKVAQAYSECMAFWEWFTNQFQLIDTQFIEQYHNLPRTSDIISLNHRIWIDRHAPWKMTERPMYRRLVTQANDILKRHFMDQRGGKR